MLERHHVRHVGVRLLHVRHDVGALHHVLQKGFKSCKLQTLYRNPGIQAPDGNSSHESADPAGHTQRTIARRTESDFPLSRTPSPSITAQQLRNGPKRLFQRVDPKNENESRLQFSLKVNARKALSAFGRHFIIVYDVHNIDSIYMDMYGRPIAYCAIDVLFGI